MRIRVKICGITRIEDAKHAVSAGADALGFVFYPKSPRYVTPKVASDIIKQLPPFVNMVGLFVNANKQDVSDILDSVPLDLLQFHGDESEADCNAYNKPYIKAIRVRSTAMIEAAQDEFWSARALLLDAYKPGIPGGTGEAFDWDLIPSEIERKTSVILAGGLNSDNVTNACVKVAPYAVDVSGGVESSKGIKDHQKVNDFINEVSCVDRNENN